MGSMSQVKGVTEKKVQVQVPISSSWCLESDMTRYGGQVRWRLLVKEEAGKIKVNACMFFWPALTRQQKSAPQPWTVANWSSLPLTSRLWPGVLRVAISSLTSGGLSALRKGTNQLTNGNFKSMFYFSQESKYAFKIISDYAVKNPGPWKINFRPQWTNICSRRGQG